MANAFLSFKLIFCLLAALEPAALADDFINAVDQRCWDREHAERQSKHEDKDDQEVAKPVCPPPVRLVQEDRGEEPGDVADHQDWETKKNACDRTASFSTQTFKVFRRFGAIELAGATALEVKLVPVPRISCCAPMTDPAELVQTEGAGHVVAALGALDNGLAHRAVRNVSPPFPLESLQNVGFHILNARAPLVPLVFALEADFGRADRTN